VELVYVVVGGLLALAGGAVTAFFSHRLGRQESSRQNLVAVYVEWSTRLTLAVEEWKQLHAYDEVAQLSAKHEELREFPASPAGRSREEIVRSLRRTMGDLEAACSRILLAETSDSFAERAIQISDFSSENAVPYRIDFIVQYADEKRTACRELMRALRREHPQLKAP
jgi:hypothetical protein